ncbi:Coat F domain-containing protein [Lentibacillus halodurans]|uniref:Coat F domain-containing protein n=1 Tax=Lentibacillus halodurans TaxID=237679 RepID=A0A1I0Z8C1_9BACI|nr:DUF3231 family protein [Lentibacillus halodurans]SFB21864.1 Coat F domain-containing protein [Lentibacillus halodurans]
MKYSLAEDAGTLYTVALAESTHADVRQYYYTCLTRTVDLIEELTGLMDKKGLLNPKIQVPTPGSIEKVQDQSFVGGWFSGNRPLNTMEITRITACFRHVEVKKELLNSFVQITSSKQLQKHFKRGEQLTKKHLEVMQDLLDRHDLPHLQTLESDVTDSTVPPFSDRLMLFKISVFVSMIMGHYATALSTVMRKDIGVDFGRLMSEIGLYGEDTLNLMIKMGFLNQMPLAKKTER